MDELETRFQTLNELVMPDLWLKPKVVQRAQIGGERNNLMGPDAFWSS